MDDINEIVGHEFIVTKEEAKELGAFEEDAINEVDAKAGTEKEG